MKGCVWGMAVLLAASTGYAADRVAGQITLVNDAKGYLDVSGVRVIVKDAAMQNSAGAKCALADLKPGDGVEAEGAFTGPGELTASRAAQKASVPGGLSGKLQGRDRRALTMDISWITVKVPLGDAILSAKDRKVSFDHLKKGDRVKCTGTWTGFQEFTADKVEIE